jgi:hypothetical protein
LRLGRGVTNRSSISEFCLRCNVDVMESDVDDVIVMWRMVGWGLEEGAFNDLTL